VLSAEKDGTVLYSNESGELLLHEWGIEVGERLPLGIVDLVQRVISRNSPEKTEVKVGKRVYLIVFHPLSEQECVHISGFDIGDQKKLEEKLWESEEKYRYIVETAREGIWLIDRNNRTVFVNQRLSEMLGYSIDEILGQSPQKFMSPEFRAEEGDRLLEHSQGVSHIIDYRFIRKDGSDLWSILSSSPLFDDQGKYAGSLAIITDITERKQAEVALRESEEHFRALVTASSEIVYHVSADWSEMHYLYGRGFLANTESPSLTWLQEYILPEDRQHVMAVINEAIRTKSTYELEHRVRLADGSLGWIFSRAVPMLDAKGEIVEWFGSASDITRRKKVEAKLKDTLDNLDKLVKERTVELQKAYDSLKKSEKSLEEAQEMAHIGNWERDLVSNDFHWSDEMYRIFGLKPQESKVNYDTFLNYVHPDDRRYIDNAFQGALNGKPFNIDFRIILASGEERIAHAKGEVVFDEKNSPVRIRGITQDITEHKKAEEKIQVLANAVESSTDAIITKSLDGVITSWNRGAEHVYGYLAEEVLGKPISILEPSTLTGEARRLDRLIKRGEEIHNYETSRLRKDGTIINVSMTLSPIFDASGKLTAISAIARDITETKTAEEKLRESEEKYRNIVETSNEGIYLVDDEAKIIYVNRIMETSGYTLEELIGRPIWDFISEESKPVARRSFEKRRQGIDDSYELRLIRKDGSFIWGLVSAKSLFDKEGKFIGYLGMLIDITERKKAEEALASIETARKKEIHHRIKNNLQVISSLLDLQAEHFRNRENIKDSEVLEAFRESQDRVISMALIHEELYRGEGFETLNFSLYIRELAENLLLTYRLGDTDITLKMDLEENLLFDVDAAVPLGMIVNELISNSLKHAFPDRKRGEIRIKLSREKNEECMKSIAEDCKSTNFILVVSDDGVGIPENLDIENLDSLGFQLVTSLVDQLDGEFELKRKNGTEFTMRFIVTEKDDPA
jgi:PAS domain S-box-containing protein